MHNNPKYFVHGNVHLHKVHCQNNKFLVFSFSIHIRHNYKAQYYADENKLVDTNWQCSLVTTP